MSAPDAARRPATRQDLPRLKAWFEEHLLAWLPAPGGMPPVLHEAMRYACADGKRVRPLLCAGAAIACGGSEGEALAPAVALELVHCYSLVHDDLPAMDNDTLRRGRPTLHVRYGEAQAILAGDALLTRAFEALTDPALGELPAAVRVALVRELAVASGSEGMAGGQVDELDVAAPGSDAGGPGSDVASPGNDVARARRIASLKTGALLRAAARMGAIAAGAGPELITAATGFGEAFGLAYQVVDDLGDEAKDVAIGRNLNFAVALGRAGAATMARELCAGAVSRLDAARAPGPTLTLRQLVDMLSAAIPAV